MTEPHVASDDMAIIAAQARVWDGLTARARALFDRACKDPSVHALEAVSRILITMHHHHYAVLRERSGTANPVPLTVHTSETGKIG